MALSDNAKLNAQAVLVLVVAVVVVVAVLLVPNGHLLPVVVALVVAVGLALLGIKAYLRRLENAVDFLIAAGSADRAGGLVAVLTDPERNILRVGDVTDVAATIALLKERQGAIISFGTYVGIVGVGAGLAAIFLIAV